MSERTGLDPFVLSTLECLEELGALPDRTFVKSAKAVDRLYKTRGTPPRFGYDAICTISTPWLVHVQLIDFHGNFGSADDNDPPAGARYTEVRLAPAGAMALEAERGDLPRLPIGLVNGDLSFGGTSPPFDPVRVAVAVHAAAIGASDTELNEMVGLPAFPTGCSVEGDLTALASGANTLLRLRADVTIEAEDREPRIVISHFPLGVGAEDARTTIAARIDAARYRRLRRKQPELHEQLDLPLRDVRNESAGDNTRLVCNLLADADPEKCRERLLEVWPVSTEFAVRLWAPLPMLLREVAAGSTAQNEAITALITSRPVW